MDSVSAGGGFDTVSRGAYHLGSALQQRDEEEARAWSASALSQARLDWTQQLTDRQSKAKPGAPGFAPEVIRDFDTYAEGLIGTAPTNAAKTYMKQRLDDLRANVGGQAVHFEAQARVDWRTDQFTKAIDNTAKLMNTDPSQYKDAMAERLTEIDGSALPPIQKSALREKAINGISAAAVWSQIQKSPTEFLQSIGFEASQGADGKLRKSSGDLTGVTGNAAFDMLPFDKRAQLFEGAVRLKAQINADADRVVKDKAKATADEAMKNVWNLWGNGKLTMQYMDSVRPVLSAEQYHSGLVALKAQQAGHGQKTDPGVFRELLRLEQTDPQQAEIYAYSKHKAGLLSNEHLSSEVNRIRAQGRQEGPKSPYERGTAYIARQLDPGPMVQDPVGKSRYADAVDTFDRWVNSGKRTESEITERSYEIVKQYKFINFNDTVLALPTPRSGSIARVNDPVRVLKDVAAAKAVADQKHRNGQMPKAEYDEEMRIMARWVRAANEVQQGTQK